MLRGRDPSAVAVMVEDSVAVGGVFIAATCLGLAHYTGNLVYDAIGSITIGGITLLASYPGFAHWYGFGSYS